MTLQRRPRLHSRMGQQQAGEADREPEVFNLVIILGLKKLVKNSGA